MSMQTGKKTTNGIKFSPRRIIPRVGAPAAILALMFSGLLITEARASSLIDPDPEDSTTQFGFSVAVIGDINGDAVPDLAVGARF
jgi:FG-GAP repeat protein